MNSRSLDTQQPLMSRSAGIALLVFLFTTGFVLMGFEMLGARYLNPWFGGGITTWASLISVVLLAMMVGYMGGGTIADRSRGLMPMALAILVAGLNMLAVAVFADGWMETILETIGDGFWGVLTGSLILCFLPVMCLAGLSPYVVKMLLREISHGGRITGLVYSVSTAGNIAGTLVTVFWLIPSIGTRSITRIFAAVLIVLAVMLIVQSRRQVTSTALLLAMMLVPLNPVGLREARAETVVYKASYPEGPLWVGETLYFAEMTADRISKIEKGGRSVFWSEAGCGPTAITEYGPDAFAIACHLGARVAIVSRDGKTLRSITHGFDGRPLRNPNDINSQGGAPVFFSDPGPFNPDIRASGRIYRLDEKGEAHIVHEGLKYPNGIAFEAKTNTLYASEHLAQRVWAFTMTEELTLKSARVEIEGTLLLDTTWPDNAYAGPDGLRIAEDGTLHAAIYGAGAIVTHKDETRRIRVPMQYVTSIALSANKVAITGAEDNRTQPYPGRLLVVDRESFETSERIGF